MNFILEDVLLGLSGGLMIGTASAVFLLGNGRIAGISGILGGLLRGQAQWPENLAFLAGLIGAPLLYAVAVAPPDIGITREAWAIVVGGLLVGLGTRIGSGCTSGHGVCGMTRFSSRSLAATMAFMAVGVAMATLIRPLLGAG